MVDDWLPVAKREADKGNDDKAISYYKLCLALDMDNIQVHDGLIDFLKKGNGNKFQKIYTEIKTTYPQSTAIRDTLPGRCFQQGVLLEKSGDFKTALRKFKDAEFFNPSYEGLGKEIKTCNESIANLERIEKNKNLAKSQYDSAMQELEAGRYDKAVPLFKKAGELDTSYSDYLNVIKEQGLDDLKKNKLNNAAAKLGLVLINNVENVDLHKKLIDACIENNNIDCLVDVYANITAEFPFEETLRKVLPEYYYNQALKHKNSKNKEKALLGFKIVQMLKPQYGDVGTQIEELMKK
jgi:tetratricopeptide (TPR) repeat protein